jgi:hypothetical protein
VTVAKPGPDDREFVSFDEAVALLPDGDTIHTFRNPGPAILLGADWPRSRLLDALRDAREIELTGPAATAMGHGIAIDHGGRTLYVATANKVRP